MPLNSTKCDEDPLCYGYHWKITDEDLLADLVARLLLGHYRHVQEILSGNGNGTHPKVNDATIREIVRKLSTPPNDELRYHRDGWVFQMITWIATRQVERGYLTAIPHTQPADKGLDNLIVRLSNNEKAVAAVVICEDKATTNARTTIRSKVWPEFVNFETGYRDHELVAEVTAILERHPNKIDIDKCLSSVFWERDRHYRVAITTSDACDSAQRRSLFKDYDAKVLGDKARRRAETVQINDLRNWMDKFCRKVISKVKGKRCTTR